MFLLIARNVICSSVPTLSKLHAQVYEFAKEVSLHLIPRTTAYHEIWLDKKMVAGDAVQDFEPLYGEFYLPRKVPLTLHSVTASYIRRSSSKLLLPFLLRMM